MTRLPLDVTRDDSVRDFMERAKQIGAPDAVIHCAAVLCFGSCEETALADYARVMETNFLSMVRVNQQVLPLMREKGGGKVVLFSSINGLMGLPFQSAYTASKHAIEGYAECLAQEVTPFGIQVMLIEPGDHRGGLVALPIDLRRDDRRVSLLGGFPQRNGNHPPRRGKRV